MKWTLILFLMGFGLLPAKRSLNIQVTGGEIKGYETREGVRVFKGIPFAAPPVGDLRWKAPQPVEAWEGTRDCTKFGASPMQAAPMPFMFWSTEFLIPKEPIGEDCLYLNVWTKAKADKEKRPVLVYIYGGGFRSGGAGCSIYDGEAMAEKGVVFVSINYRVGVFGFLAHPELTKESGYNASGNYALLDMIAGLKWVQENINQFGGDPNNVTIAGQSAGAFAVNFLVASPLAKGLFQKAIAESGASFVSSGIGPKDLAEGEKDGTKFAESLKCQSIAELRAKSAEEILKANGPSGPVIDGYLLPASVYEIFANGNQNDVPTLIGWNKDDRFITKAAKSQAFVEQVKKRFGDFSNEFLKVYPSKTETESAYSQFEMNRDETFGVNGYYWARMQNKTGKSPIYVYNFNHDLPAETPETDFGAFHSGEIVYFYNNLQTLNRPWKKVDYKLADEISSYIANFAKTGDPNSKGLAEWNAFTPKDQNILLIIDKCSSVPLPGYRQLSVWEKYYSYQKSKKEQP